MFLGFVHTTHIWPFVQPYLPNPTTYMDMELVLFGQSKDEECVEVL